jgi:hypothetical protein
MKIIIILLIAASFQLSVFPQQNEIIYTDISPDGKEISTYIKDKTISSGTVIKLTDDIPYGLTPDWSSTLDRQIGGMGWADYDDDGDLDLATGCYFSQSFPPIPEYEVLIYRNDYGVLTTTPAWISSDMRSTTDIRFADLDGDGRPELLAANGDQSFVPSVIYFNGPGGLNNIPGWISADNNWTVGAAFGDIDGDGDLDLVFGNQGNTVTPAKPMCAFYNNGGTFSTTPNWLSADQMLASTVAFGDLDNQQLITKISEFTGDGTKYAFPLLLFPIYSVDSVLIDGLPYLQYCYDPISGWISLGTKPDSGIPVRVVYKYISKGDVAVSKWVNYESGVYFNNNGVLNTLPGWTVGNTLSQKGTAFADFDNDGFMDLAISGSGTQTVIYKNVNGVLTGPVWTSNTVNPSAQELITGDIDRDGYPELAVVHFGTRRIEIFKNRNGVLDTVPTWLYIAGTSATSISFGDVNGDGALDLAVGTARSPVVVFINQLPPIPVELSSFTASVNGNDVELQWLTSSEVNNLGFEILRSAQNDIWERVGFVEGKGTTTEVTSYSFNDKIFIPGVYNYSLKQIDFDGTFKYYNLSESVEVGLPAEFELSQNYPNPFNPKTRLSFVIGHSSLVTLKVYDVLGNEVAKLINEDKPAGVYKTDFDASLLSSGVYYYELRAGGFVETKKMILLR